MKNKYKCVNCGQPAGALYRTYGPSVLKLTKCQTCKGTVDKYIEYDPVIIIIDLVLMSKEAQRHIIYNTEFKIPLSPAIIKCEKLINHIAFILTKFSWNIMKNKYKCVNCGQPAGALYRTYGPSVLKLTKCQTCKGTVDKYIEYDPVIIMIDLVLMSKEAQRHIIYNTEFKIYWKLFIILLMLETYGLWRNDSLLNIAINSLCDIRNNCTLNTTHISLPIDLSLSESYRSKCRGWEIEDRDTVDLFIWEKNFYIQFISTFIGIIMFISTLHITMIVFQKTSILKRVSTIRVLKSFSLANTSLLFTLPMLVWGNSDTPPETRLLHYALVFCYSCVVYYNVFYVLYEGSRTVTVVALVMSNCLKYLTTFHTTPLIRQLLQ